MPSSAPSLSRTAWLIVLLLMPVATLNYLDRHGFQAGFWIGQDRGERLTSSKADGVVLSVGEGGDVNVDLLVLRPERVVGDAQGLHHIAVDDAA